MSGPHDPAQQRPTRPERVPQPRLGDGRASPGMTAEDRERRLREADEMRRTGMAPGEEAPPKSWLGELQNVFIATVVVIGLLAFILFFGGRGWLVDNSGDSIPAEDVGVLMMIFTLVFGPLFGYLMHDHKRPDQGFRLHGLLPVLAIGLLVYNGAVALSSFAWRLLADPVADGTVKSMWGSPDYALFMFCVTTTGGVVCVLAFYLIAVHPGPVAWIVGPLAFLAVLLSPIAMALIAADKPASWLGPANAAWAVVLVITAAAGFTALAVMQRFRKRRVAADAAGAPSPRPPRADSPDSAGRSGGGGEPRGGAPVSPLVVQPPAPQPQDPRRQPPRPPQGPPQHRRPGPGPRPPAPGRRQGGSLH